MRKINDYKINYVNDLYADKRIVLRGIQSDDRSPVMSMWITENSDLVLRIEEGIDTQVMETDPNKGAKNRFDLHINSANLTPIIEDLGNVIYNESLKMDSSKYKLYDPTGQEHSDGLPLAKVTTLATIPANVDVHYGNESVIKSGNITFIDAEAYSTRKTYHIGAWTTRITERNTENKIEIVISSTYVVRFHRTLKLAQQIFANK